MFVNEVDPCTWREGSIKMYKSLFMRLFGHVNVYNYLGVTCMTITLIHYSGMLLLQNGNHSCVTCPSDHVTISSNLSAASFITSVAERVKIADPSSPDNHYILIDSLSVLLRRHGLSAVTKLLDALPGSQLPGEN